MPRSKSTLKNEHEIPQNRPNTFYAILNRLPVLGGECPRAQQHGREEELELGLPELLVHLESDLLDDEEGAREVVLGAVLDEVRHEVVHGEVEDDLDGAVGARVPSIWRSIQ